MVPLTDYESLSREGRLRRVCTLLAKAVTLAWIREQAANGDAKPIPVARKEPGPVVAVFQIEIFTPTRLSDKTCP